MTLILLARLLIDAGNGSIDRSLATMVQPHVLLQYETVHSLSMTTWNLHRERPRLFLWHRLHYPIRLTMSMQQQLDLVGRSHDCSTWINDYDSDSVSRPAHPSVGRITLQFM